MGYGFHEYLSSFNCTVKSDCDKCIYCKFLDTEITQLSKAYSHQALMHAISFRAMQPESAPALILCE